MSEAPAYRREEYLICVLARMLQGLQHIAVGTSSPIPGCAALLLQAENPGRVRAMMLGSNIHNSFNDGGPEVHDRAAQGRIDAFFLGGGQIDGEANINLVGIGAYPQSSVRFPGSYGSAFLYFLIPRVILFREEHSRRVFVPKVDFISAPGWSPPGIHRTGGPYALVTSLCVFMFDRVKHRFRLDSLHPGHTIEEVRDNTGFDFDCPQGVGQAAPPELDRLALIRTRIAREIAEVYPQFARTRLGLEAA